MATHTQARMLAPRGIGHLLSDAAASHPDDVALVTTPRTLTYGELDAAAARLAHALTEQEIQVGDRVSIYSENRWEWIVAYHAAMRMGAVVNPVNMMLTAEELAYVANDCGVKALFVSASTAVALGPLRQEAPGIKTVVSFDGMQEDVLAFDDLIRGDLCLEPVDVDVDTTSTIGYTSGTTGHPKGASQSHRAVMTNVALTATMHVRTAADVMVTALPAPHVYGNAAINATFLAGGTVVLMARFEPAQALGLIERHRATMFEGVPTMYAMMLSDPALESADLTSLTRCTVGGQTMSAESIRSWERRAGAPLLELWGMTEISGLGATHSPYATNVHGSIGVALPGIELRVANTHGDEVPTGEHGELHVRGPIVMQGYFGNPEATAEVLLDSGWLRTGDIAYRDASGHYFVVDRVKDVIITGGYNVYPAEVERVIASHPDVSLVAVGREFDAVKGELAVAYVVPRGDAEIDEAALIDYCRPHLAAYKLPRRVVRVSTLPMTSTGKIMRRSLGAGSKESR
ncbi:AMP-binding protein [Streptosporangium sp. NPDC006930]|uniref:class I adenylate-forming enzyme family protein n=1 Tax=unclassified Streptosporangium TaxID=2632669 RepID=UPI00341E9A3B